MARVNTTNTPVRKLSADERKALQQESSAEPLILDFPNVDPLTLLDQLDETKLGEIIVGLERRLEALRVLQRAVQTKNGTLPTRKARGPNKTKPAASSGESSYRGLALRIYHCIKSGGPLKAEDIAERIGLDFSAVLSYLENNDAYRRDTANRWSLEKA